MQSKAPARGSAPQLDERKQQLVTFVETAIRSVAPGRQDAVLMIARSPDSPVARAVLSISDLIGRQGLGGRLVFACSEAVSAGDVWQLSFDKSFAHEARLLPDPRVLGAHEQLIVGDTALWWGDNMRRDPSKRDAFQAMEADVASIAQARRTFARLWQSATPLYGHGGGTVAAAPKVEGAPAVGVECSANASTGDVVAADVVATLAAWQPAIKH